MATTRKLCTLEKLTALERRAKTMCDGFRAQYEKDDGPLIVVKWTKSRTWGMCPSIYDGDRVAYASGCGYDKLSAVLAEALRWMGETPELRVAISRSSGVGVSRVQETLRAAGWDLRAGYTDSTTDTYSLIRLEAKP